MPRRTTRFRARFTRLKFIDADVNVFLVVRSGVIAFPVIIIATVVELADVAIVIIRQPVDVLAIQLLVPPQISDEFMKRDTCWIVNETLSGRPAG